MLEFLDLSPLSASNFILLLGHILGGVTHSPSCKVSGTHVEDPGFCFHIPGFSLVYDQKLPLFLSPSSLCVSPFQINENFKTKYSPSLKKKTAMG